MSQHRFTTQLDDIEIVVIMGWDRPLQGFFMSIIQVSPEPKESSDQEAEAEDVYLFNNLEQSLSHPKELTAYLCELDNRGINLPEQMIAEVTMDGVRNEGNKFVVHSIVDGKHIRNQLS